ncbi:phytoene desaturase [Rhodoferax sp. U2-2l]|uniref:phytoene desaturase n=1 Tax=Rhodoferax sp. U2-2l TaxID=2884000 RepID=UPI001D0A0DE0|nr:phytoene desaturase [Rhodoferax sp. U2-2l]MCB8746592.1 phytoene desaturase [Rhodoferax sp. U2-2l]
MNAFSNLEIASAKHEAHDKRPTAIVIGSGFGGLAAAVRLSCKGYRVQVLEKQDQAGGRAAVWRRDGFTFDAGPTIVTAPYMLEELWTMCGRRLADDVTLIPTTPFYRIRFDDGSHFDYGSDQQANRDQIKKICPSDLPGYEAFIKEAEACYQLGFQELGSIVYDSPKDLLRAIPNMLRLRGWRSMYAMVSSYMKDPKLRAAFTLQSLLIGGNPLSVTGIYALINALERRFGVHWAMGGTGSVVRGLVSLLNHRQVPIRLNAEVRRILVDQGRATGVELASGERIDSDIVVSNGDTAWTYRHLIDAKHRPHWTDKRIEGKKYSMGLFVWYFGTNKRYEDVPHHTMVLGPRYQELLDDIFKKKHLADDFSLYLHRPTASDPGMAPAGCDTFYALSPVPHLDSGTDWKAMGELYRQRIEKRLSETLLPDLKSHIVTSQFTTPQDFHDRLLSFKGAGFGMEPLLLQSAYFRPHNRSEDIKGLFMVGAGTHPGAGVPGVLMSAKALEQVVPHANSFA